MDPKTLLESAAADLAGLPTAPTSDKINMLQMVQIPLNMALMTQSITSDMMPALDSIRASIKAEKDASAKAPDAQVLEAEGVVLNLLDQCIQALPTAAAVHI
jgi:hypothetical protein